MGNDSVTEGFGDSRGISYVYAMVMRWGVDGGKRLRDGLNAIKHSSDMTQHHKLDTWPILKDKIPMYINEPWIIDKDIVGG